jgi:hypothetical protein
LRGINSFGERPEVVGASFKDAYFSDQAERDTVALINRYGCQGPIIDPLVKHLSVFSRNNDSQSK